MTEVDMKGSILKYATLNSCTLIDVNMTNSNLIGADLKDAQCAGVQCEEINLEGSDLTYANFEGANFKKLNPRIKTIGRPSSACPCKSEAADDSSSAIASSLTRKGFLKRSGRPRRSKSAGIPETPSAVPVVPFRQARPRLSLIMTASLTLYLS